MLKLPYGISNFIAIRKEHYVYLDRTPFIPTLEQAGKQLLFLRPRRFGKSLLLSMLNSYYDIKQADQFASLFGDLAIGQNPTSEQNQYLILHWDFSAVSPQGDVEQIKRSLFAHLNRSIELFAATYQGYLTLPIHNDLNDGITAFESLLNAVSHSGYQLYLLIDEYDNFANEILMHNQGDKVRYSALLEGEGILKSLFKVIKARASQGSIARVFITGVSPVVMSDMTSGYNVSKNISLEDEFNILCGMTETELNTLVKPVLHTCQKEAAQPSVMDTLRQFYNGYRFSYDLNAPRIYNPILCFHFLQAYQKSCAAPRQMLDGNLAMDKGRIRYIAGLAGGQAVIDRLLDEENPSTLNELASDFGIGNLERVQQDADYMLSLLYYFGVVTLDGVNEVGRLSLKIPNLVVRGLYLEELKRHALPDIRTEKTAQAIAEQFYQDANVQALADFMEQKYFKVFSNRDYRWSNELTIKTAFASLLYNDLYYIMDSETALARRYTDLIMIIRPNMRQYRGLQDIIFEFKYLSLSELNLTGEQLKNLSREALAQLPVVQAALQDALRQLTHYRQVLTEKYQEPERLHALAVVALGFERVVWQVVN
ncbi:AAA family ATPase [Thiolinea disciformis]|uniref:AAA family ATPase n=1 Tax=Thiolinea disciformis TaxID=125614 RepID=UPI000369DEEF|nr:AAA family ATPase [Thiolinea disciformis]